MISEGHCLGFAALQMDALKAFQFLDGTGNACTDVVDVELNNLVAVAFSSVLYGERSLNGAVCVHRGSTESKVAILVCGVRQSVSEGIESVVAHVHVIALILEEAVCALGN